jgi:hypothetical protein
MRYLLPLAIIWAIMPRPGASAADQPAGWGPVQYLVGEWTGEGGGGPGPTTPRRFPGQERGTSWVVGFILARARGFDGPGIRGVESKPYVAIDGPMPAGGTNRVAVAVCAIPALLAMKGYALEGRCKQNDAYDIYCCIRNYPDGIGAQAAACRPLINQRQWRTGLPLHRREV